MSRIVDRIRAKLADVRPVRRAGLILLVLAAFTAGGASAWAYWTTSGSGAATGTSGTLNAPTNPAGNNTIGSRTVSLTWTGSTLSTGQAAQGYYVTRIRNSDSSPYAACGTSAAAPTTATSCADLAVPDGTFHYTVTAVYNTWTATSASTIDVTVRTAAKLAFTTSPSATAISQTAFVTQPVVTVQDAAGVTITTDTSLVTLTLTTPNGATLACNANTTGATSGVATFAGCKIDKAGTYTLTATDGSLTPDVSSNVAVTAGAAAKFVITSTAVSGLASNTANLGPITVQRQDFSGNPVTAGSTNVNLASNSSGTAVFSATLNGATVTFVTIPAGSSSTNFYYGDTKTGSPVITVSGSLTSATQTETITAGAPTKLAITSTAVSGIKSSTANLGPITVQLQGSLGNPTTSASDTVVTLTSTSAGKIFAATLNGASVTTVTIPAGASSTTFYYGDTTSGSPVITGSSGALTSANQTETITPTKVVITSTAVSGSASTTANLGAITVQEQDSNGVPFNAPAGGTVVSLSSNSAGTKIFATTLNGTPAVTSVTIPAGSSSTTFYYGDTKAGSPVITVSGLSTTYTQTETINAGAPTKYAITSTAVSGTASATASLGPITVQRQDSYGNPVNAPGGDVVTLVSDGPSSPWAHVFATALNGTPAVTSVTIPAGSSSTTFYYGDTKAGSPVITVSGSLTSGTQTETITAAAANKFAITSTAVSGSASATANLGPITVQEQDSFGNPVNAPPGGTTVSLGSSSTGTKIFATTSGGGSVGSVTILAGASSTTFWYGDTKTGSPVITVSGSLTSGTQTETITAAAANKFAITSTAVSGSASTTANLGPITVEVQDSLGNPVNAPAGGIVVTLGSNSSGTKIFAATFNGTPAVTSVTIPAGASSTTFWYGDTKAGSPTITGSGSLTSATQIETISAAAANKLAFGVQPTNTVAGVSISPVPTVQILDAFGNLTTSTASVTVAIGTNPGSGTLSGTATLNAVGGVATFPGLSINKAGTGYTLTTTSTGLTAAPPSSSFNITAAAANKLAFTTVVSGNKTATATATIGPFAVQAQDSFGNPVVNTGSAVTLTLSSSSTGTKFFTPTSGGASAGAVTIANGASTSSSFFYADTKAGGPTLTAAGTVNTVVMNTGTTSGFTVVATAANKLAFTTVVSGNKTATATATIGPFAVQAQDSFGNPVVNTGSAVTLTLSSSSTGTKFFTPTSGGASAGAVTIANGASTSSNFFYADTKAGGPTLTAAGTVNTVVMNTGATSGFTVVADVAVKFAITSTAVSGIKSSTANLGPITVQEQDSFGNPVNATGAGTSVNLSSTNPKSGIPSFAVTQNGTSVTGVTIPVGASSTTFWFGYSKAATPTITVSGSLTSASQIETTT